MNTEGLYGPQVALSKDAELEEKLDPQLEAITTKIAETNVETAKTVVELSEKARKELDRLFNLAGGELGWLKFAPDDGYTAAQLMLFESAIKKNDMHTAIAIGKKIQKLTQ